MTNSSQSLELRSFVLPNVVFLFAGNSLTRLTILLAKCVHAWTLPVFPLISARTTHLLEVENVSVS